MDSLAQCHLWLIWETDAAIAPSLVGAIAASQPSVEAKPGRAIALGRRSLAIVAGAIVLGSGLGAPALANRPWGSTVYAVPLEGYALNVRENSGTNSKVNRCVLRGSPLQVSGVERNGWVQLIDGKWVAGEWIINTDQVARVEGGPVAGVGNGTVCNFATTRPNPKLATVKTPPNFALNVRSGPGRNFPVVGQFVNGSRIELTSRFYVGWAQLTNGNWVDSGHIEYSGPRIEDPPLVVERCNQPKPNSDLSPTTNADVLELQRLLCQAGFLPPDFIVSGIYDPTTQNAVREFQRVNGLPVTGIVDAATWNALYRATAPIQPPIDSRQRRVDTGDSGEAQIYDGPGPEFTLVRSVPNGTILTVTGNTTGNWSELVEGGWIFTPWLDPI